MINFIYYEDYSCFMAKTISVNEYVYAELASISGELTSLARKPISMGMTLLVALKVFRDWLGQPQIRNNLRKLFETTEVVSPEAFDVGWEKAFQEISGGTKK